MAKRTYVRRTWLRGRMLGGGGKRLHKSSVNYSVKVVTKAKWKIVKTEAITAFLSNKKSRVVNFICIHTIFD